MKQYRRVYEDISRPRHPNVIEHIGSVRGSVDELASRYRNFYREAHGILFDLMVKEKWLEGNFTYNGKPRFKRGKLGLAVDAAFGYFTKSVVGITQKALTSGFFFHTIPTYFNDFFPEFYKYDPFEEPERYQFPYKNIHLDHLVFVYQHPERLELLAEGEQKAMNAKDFINWACNHALCYNDEIGEEIYKISRHNFIPYIKNTKRISS